MDLRVPLDVTGSSWWIINWNCSKNSQSFPLGQNTRPHTILILQKMPTKANVSQQEWIWSQSLLTELLTETVLKKSQSFPLSQNARPHTILIIQKKFLPKLSFRPKNKAPHYLVLDIKYKKCLLKPMYHNKYKSYLRVY